MLNYWREAFEREEFRPYPSPPGRAFDPRGGGLPSSTSVARRYCPRELGYEAGQGRRTRSPWRTGRRTGAVFDGRRCGHDDPGRGTGGCTNINEAMAVLSRYARADLWPKMKVPKTTLGIDIIHFLYYCLTV